MGYGDNNSGNTPGMFGGIIDLVTAVKNLGISANTINQTLAKVFPQSIGTSASAVGGGATLPPNPVGFMVVINPATGASVKVPYYT